MNTAEMIISPPSMDMGGRLVPISQPADRVATIISVIVNSAAVGAGMRLAPQICPSMAGNNTTMPNSNPTGTALTDKAWSRSRLASLSLRGDKHGTGRNSRHQYACYHCGRRAGEGGVCSRPLSRERLTPNKSLLQCRTNHRCSVG